MIKDVVWGAQHEAASIVKSNHIAIHNGGWSGWRRWEEEGVIIN